MLNLKLCIQNIQANEVIVGVSYFINSTGPLPASSEVRLVNVEERHVFCCLHKQVTARW